MEIFKKVPNSEKKIIFRDLANSKVEVLMKIPNKEEVYQLISKKNINDEYLLCDFEGDIDFEGYLADIIFNFNTNSDRYFFTSEIVIKKDQAQIKIKAELFSLQRRKNFRLPIPKEFYALFVAKRFNGENATLEFEVIDVSAGGCKLFLKRSNMNIKAGDLFVGELRLGKKNPITLDSNIRHVAEAKGGGYILGVQFVNVDRILENRLYATMMDLQRELFVNFGS